MRLGCMLDSRHSEQQQDGERIHRKRKRSRDDTTKWERFNAPQLAFFAVAEESGEQLGKDVVGAGNIRESPVPTGNLEQPRPARPQRISSARLLAAKLSPHRQQGKETCPPCSPLSVLGPTSPPALGVFCRWGGPRCWQNFQAVRAGGGRNFREMASGDDSNDVDCLNDENAAPPEDVSQDMDIATAAKSAGLEEDWEYEGKGADGYGLAEWEGAVGYRIASLHCLGSPRADPPSEECVNDDPWELRPLKASTTTSPGRV